MIDSIDYSILTCISGADKALWKKKIQTYLRDQLAVLPMPEESISLQTVSRHVDRLHEQQLVSSAIINPDELKRNLIIGYQITRDGRQAMREKRRQILENVLSTELFSNTKTTCIRRTALAVMIADELQLDKCTRNVIMERYSREKLLTMMGLHMLTAKTMVVFDEIETQRIRNLLQDPENLSALI